MAPNSDYDTDGGENLDFLSLVILEALMKHVEKQEQEGDMSNFDKAAILPCNYFDEIIGSETGGLISNSSELLISY